MNTFDNPTTNTVSPGHLEFLKKRFKDLEQVKIEKKFDLWRNGFPKLLEKIQYTTFLFDRLPQNSNAGWEFEMGNRVIDGQEHQSILTRENPIGRQLTALYAELKTKISEHKDMIQIDSTMKSLSEEIAYMSGELSWISEKEASEKHCREMLALQANNP